MIVWNPKGIPTRSMENMKWYSPSQVSTAKHVSYPQLTATNTLLIRMDHYWQWLWRQWTWPQLFKSQWLWQSMEDMRLPQILVEFRPKIMVHSKLIICCIFKHVIMPSSCDGLTHHLRRPFCLYFIVDKLKRLLKNGNLLKSVTEKGIELFAVRCCVRSLVGFPGDHTLLAHTKYWGPEN